MEPSQTAVIRSLIESRLLDVRTMLPGQIVSYDASKETATVKVMVKDLVPAGDGSSVPESIEDIDDVPVAFPRGGGGGVFLKWKPQTGDGCMLQFSQWSHTGARKGNAREPFDPTMHSLSHPVAVLGFGPSADNGASVSGSEVVLEGPEVHLGHGASQFVALADLVKSELDAIAGMFTTFISGSGGASFPNSYTPSSVAASKVKAK